MTTQALIPQQVERKLVENEVYYINTSHERERPYIYEGMTEERHRFFREGAIRDSMRRILVESHNLHFDRNSVSIGIIDDRYKVDSVSKDGNLEEYSRLEKLW